MGDVLQSIPPGIIKFLFVALFSLLLGLEQRRRHLKSEFETLFGTDRTYALIGILGYVLYIAAPQSLIPFLCGGAAITVLLGIYYFQRIKVQQRFGITQLVTALITYCLALIVYTQPGWMSLLIVVLVLVLTEIKETLYQFTEKFGADEFITLAKFLVLAGVIVPLLPDKPISPAINISPYKFALAIVAISGISYLSYILKKFVFPKSGIILTGILGGMYSSTATTFILARKAKESQDGNKTAAAIILATTMMYIRLFILALIFNRDIAMRLALPFGICIAASAIIVLYLLRFTKSQGNAEPAQPESTHGNPLELKTAMVFAAFFIIFALVTEAVKDHYGAGGINALSFIVGVTDIDPFIINLFQGKWNMDVSILVMATLNAITSNNLLKMVYGISLSGKSIRKQLILGFGTLIVLGLVLSFAVRL